MVDDKERGRVETYQSATSGVTLCLNFGYRDLIGDLVGPSISWLSGLDSRLG